MLLKFSVVIFALIGISAANFTRSWEFRWPPFSRNWLTKSPPNDISSTGPSSTALASKPDSKDPASTDLRSIIAAAENAAKVAGSSFSKTIYGKSCPSAKSVKTWYGKLMTGAVDQCVFCFCNETIGATVAATDLPNCEIFACPTATPDAVETWTNMTKIKNWKSLADAVNYALYKVPGGYCVITVASTGSKKMLCFEVDS